MSPTASNMLYNSVLIRLGALMILDDFLERVNASVDWREATHDATKTEMSSLAFEGEDDIMMTIGGGAAWSTCLLQSCCRGCAI